MIVFPSSSDGLRYIKLVLLIVGSTTFFSRIDASEEIAQSPTLSDSFQEQLTGVIDCFDRVSDKRQIKYLSDLLCHRYLVVMLFISMPEQNAEFKHLQKYVLALGELTARLNNRSAEALVMLDECLDTWNEFSYRRLLPEIARRIGLYELVEGLITDLDRAISKDFPYVVSLRRDVIGGIASDGRQLFDAYIRHLSNISDEAKKSPWAIFHIPSLFEKIETILDCWSDLCGTLRHDSSIAKNRLKNIRERLFDIRRKNGEVLMLCASYGDSSEYAQFRAQLAQAFFSSVHSALLNRFLHTHLCTKIEMAPKPIFTLHHLATLAQLQENSDERELFWRALKQFALIGSHFSAYQGMRCFEHYTEERFKALSKFIQKLRTQLDLSEVGAKRQQLSLMLTRSVEEKTMLEDVEDWKEHMLKVLLQRPAYVDCVDTENVYSVELNAYLNYMKDHTDNITVEELLQGLIDESQKTFFKGSEVVSDFCVLPAINPLGKYIQLFFDYYFGKKPQYTGQVRIDDLYKKFTQGNTINKNYADVMKLFDIQVHPIPDWAKPCYNMTIVKHLSAILKQIEEKQCPQQQRDIPRHLGAVAEDKKNAPEPIRSSAVDSSSIYGKKMAWHELLSKLEEIERLYIPRVSIREWSNDAGYAHCWRGQKSSLCVTYFFFKELRRQRRRQRNISLDTSTLFKQTDRSDTGWDLYHAFPTELDHTLLNEYSVRIGQDDEVWIQLGLKRDARKSYAYVVRAKIVPGYTDPIRLQDPNFEDNDFGHTGYFVWLCRGNDVCYHRQFHAVQRSSLGVCMPSPHVSPVTPLACF